MCGESNKINKQFRGQTYERERQGFDETDAMLRFQTDLQQLSIKQPMRRH